MMKTAVLPSGIVRRLKKAIVARGPINAMRVARGHLMMQRLIGVIHGGANLV
jgi:hypothetical protein